MKIKSNSITEAEMSNTDSGFQKISLDTYYRTAKVKRIKLRVKYVDDIFKRCLELDPSEENEQRLKAAKLYDQNPVCMAVLSKSSDGISYLLISKEATADPKYLQTAYYELTRMLDKVQFAEEYQNGDVEKIQCSKEYDVFKYWTEFHAMRLGFLCYWTVLSKDLSRDEQIDYIKTVEFKTQIEILFEYKQKDNKDITAVLYYRDQAFRFLGRISAWSSIFDKLKERFWLESYSDSAALDYRIFPESSLYKPLNSMRTFDDAKKHFDWFRQEVERVYGAPFIRYRHSSIYDDL